jgi:hypothetical protein
MRSIGAVAIVLMATLGFRDEPSQRTMVPVEGLAHSEMTSIAILGPNPVHPVWACTF